MGWCLGLDGELGQLAVLWVLGFWVVRLDVWAYAICVLSYGFCGIGLVQMDQRGGLKKT